MPTAVNLPTLNVSDDAIASINIWMAGQLSGVQVEQTLDITNAGTTLTVNSTTGIGANSLILVDAEIMQVSAKTATTLTIARGLLGTIAAPHVTKAIVKELKYRSYAALFMSDLNSLVQNIMEQYPSGVLATQNAAITTAQAAKAAAKLGALS